MDEFLERHKLPKLTQNKIDNSSSPESFKEIAFVVKNFPKKKSAGPDVLMVNSTTYFKKR